MIVKMLHPFNFKQYSRLHLDIEIEEFVCNYITMTSRPLEVQVYLQGVDGTAPSSLAKRN